MYYFTCICFLLGLSSMFILSHESHGALVLELESSTCPIVSVVFILYFDIYFFPFLSLKQLLQSVLFHNFLIVVPFSVKCIQILRLSCCKSYTQSVSKTTHFHSTSYTPNQVYPIFIRERGCKVLVINL